VAVGYVAGVSEVHIASIFKVEVCVLVSLNICSILFEKERGLGGWSGDWYLLA
jgi:hypothetical protein